MNMFEMNQRYSRPIIALIIVPIHIKHVHSSFSYQWATTKNTMGVVMHHLVGMGLKDTVGHYDQVVGTYELITSLFSRPHTCQKRSKIIPG